MQRARGARAWTGASALRGMLDALHRGHARQRAGAHLAGALTSPRPAMFDTTDPAFLDDPYPAFARLREQGPVQWHEGLGLYVTLTHAAADTVLRDRALGRDLARQGAGGLLPAFWTCCTARRSSRTSRPPTPGCAAWWQRAFGRGHVERLRPWVQGLADRLVGALAAEVRAGASADLVRLVAEPLPAQ